MEDDLKKNKNGRRPKKKRGKMEDVLKKRKKEDDLKKRQTNQPNSTQLAVTPL